MEPSAVKIVRAESPEAAAEWAAVLARPGWLERAATLKEERCSWVRRGWVRLPGGGREVVVKCRPASGLAERIKGVLRQTRGDRHWRGAVWLERNGFRTAHVLVLARAIMDGHPCDLLVMEALPGRSVLAHLAEGGLSARQEHAIARALGTMIARLLVLKRYNRDGKPSNLIVASLESDAAEVAIIDCVGIRRDIWFDSDEPYPSLARLVIEAIGSGCTPRRSLMARVLREVQEGAIRERGGGSVDPHVRKDAWREISELIEAHGDPRPRVDPLAAPYTHAPSQGGART